MIKAIETEYKGYRFRSRLEARWAVFFDALGLDWDYEPEGFELADGTRYLPDFFLPAYECWAEIKPIDPSAAEVTKASLLALSTGKEVLIIAGTPWITPSTDRYFEGTAETEYSVYRFPPDTGDAWMVDMGWVFVACRRCRKIGIESRGYHFAAYEGEAIGYGMCCGERAGWPYDEHLLTAYRAARAARFEHGETP